MKLLHISDTHGATPPLLDGPSLVVHSGDFMPNQTRGGPTERAYQRNWIGHHKERLKRWLDGRTFLLCRGNHDFYDPCEDMARHGIDARSITNKIVEAEGLRFYGFPYVNAMAGEWFGELLGQDMYDAIRPVVDAFNENRADVLVAHCPPYGVLDKSYGTRCGSQAMADAISYRFQRLPLAYLCGHIHEHHGATLLNWMLVSNAATVQRIVEVVGVGTQDGLASSGG